MPQSLQSQILLYRRGRKGQKIEGSEHLLTPFSKKYGIFEYTKDSSDVLQNISDLNEQISREHWNLQKATLFTIDVKALYPSVKLNLLKTALTSSFREWTDWDNTTITILVNIIMYTLENQQNSLE